MKLEDIIAKFGTNAVLLSSAVKFHAANPTATMQQLEAHLKAESEAAELAQLREFKKTREGEIAQLKAAKQTQDTELAKLKAAGFDAKDGKSSVDLVLGEIATLKAQVAELKNGAGRLDTGANPGEGSAGANATTEVARLRAELAKVTGNTPEDIAKRSEITAKLRALRNPEKK